MTPQKICRCIKIATPKRYLLDGLWFGGGHPKRAIVFVHGLGSTAFAHHEYLTPLADNSTAVLFFSNRGHDDVAGMKRIKRSAKKSYAHKSAGVAHEVFAECVDDIQGAVNLLVKNKVKEIYLVGHSTGCQKITYYLSKNGKQRKIKGAILLCPISDYAGAKRENADKLKKAEAVARKLVRRRKPHDLLPADIWPRPLDAQRFLSLYTPDSKEEIFTYAQPEKTPRTLRKVNLPLLIVFAGNDEYRDRDTEEIAEWFGNHIRSKKSEIRIIPNALHGFGGKEARVAESVRRWLSKRGL